MGTEAGMSDQAKYVLSVDEKAGQRNVEAAYRSSWVVLSRNGLYQIGAESSVIRLFTGFDTGINLLSDSFASLEAAWTDAGEKLWSGDRDSVDASLYRAIDSLLNPERLRNVEDLTAAADAAAILHRAIARRLVAQAKEERAA